MTTNRVEKHLLQTKCRARECSEYGRPLFCPPHWKQVPEDLQKKLADLYRPEFYDMRTNVRPSAEYVHALHECRDSIPEAT